MISRKSIITGTGSYLPETILTNKDMEKRVDTTDEWIQQRTGIKQRHIANETETASHMAYHAALNALEAAGLKGEDIDGIVVATSTPDTTFPSVAIHVQEKIGSTHGPHFDVQAACSGFVYALTTADSLIRTGVANKMLVIGSEKFSQILNWEDRTTCVLFGDGAGAIVLEAAEHKDGEGIEARGVHSSHLHGNGEFKDILYTDGGVATTQTGGHVVMQGRDVFKNAVELMSSVVSETLEHNGITGADIDWLVPHQANVRIIDSTRKKLGLEPEKVVVTVDKHGNTSAASIPLAFDVAVRDGRIKQGDLLLLEALGAGLTWGSVLVRF